MTPKPNLVTRKWASKGYFMIRDIVEDYVAENPYLYFTDHAKDKKGLKFEVKVNWNMTLPNDGNPRPPTKPNP